MKLSSNDLVRKLREPSAYPHEVYEIQVVETHISWVFLTGEFSYKVKKPVSLGFLDFSTLKKRKFYCEQELLINRRTAPDLYLDIVSIGAGRNGLQLGAEPALEWALRMRQFPHEARLDRRLRSGAINSAGVRRLAAKIATFHDSLPPHTDIDPDNEFERVMRPARNNFLHLEPASFDDKSQQQLAVIEAWTSQQAAGDGLHQAGCRPGGHAPPCLYLMHGFSGSGKTWVSGRLVGVKILDCQAPEDALRRRLQQRAASGLDASDAGVAVLEHLRLRYGMFRLL